MRIALALLLAGCFSPHYADGKPCSPSGECPSGFACVDGRCYRPGNAPQPDMSTPDLSAEQTDLAVQDLTTNQDLTAFDAAPDLVSPPPIVYPPASVWMSEGGGGGQATSQSQLNLSIGGASFCGQSTAPSGATLMFGVFATDTVK
jgi:hypothetical protein